MHPFQRPISVKTTDVGCDRGGAPVFRGAGFTLTPGEAVQIFGANGAGKSSLLGLLAGHFAPVEGEVCWRIGEGPWTKAAPRARVLFLGHERGAKPSLTVLENLGFWAARYGRRLQSAENTAVLTRLGLERDADAPVARLSAGQRRRLDLARFVMAGRPLWLLDEPAAFIDRQGAALIGDLVAEHQKRGGIAVVATHERLSFPSSTLTVG